MSEQGAAVLDRSESIGGGASRDAITPPHRLNEYQGCAPKGMLRQATTAVVTSARLTGRAAVRVTLPTPNPPALCALRHRRRSSQSGMAIEVIARGCQASRRREQRTRAPTHKGAC